jgi:hypothetical protein
MFASGFKFWGGGKATWAATTDSSELNNVCVNLEWKLPDGTDKRIKYAIVCPMDKYADTIGTGPDLTKLKMTFA